MDDKKKIDVLPLLVPDIPEPQEILPFWERIHASRSYTNFGPLVKELETRFSEKFDLSNEFITTVANATLGLELVLQALNLPKDARILVPAFTFVATATAVLRAGYQAVLADVDADTWMLTPEIARTACAQTRIDAVMPVATFGMPHDMGAWELFEKETGIPVVIDAAAAYGSQWLQGKKGTLVFSLHATKSLPAVEGGVVVSTRLGLAEHVRQLSNFGINLNPAAGLPIGALSQCGTNAKMSEYHAAICLVSLQKWEQRARQRRDLQAEMIQELDKASAYHLTWQKNGTGGSLMAPTLLCARLPDQGMRNQLEKNCKSANIMTRRWYQPLLSNMPALHPPRTLCLDAPHAQLLDKTLLGLPFFLEMSSSQKNRVIKVFEGLFQN
ncbi:MAG: DegT/DnrJ/EryC1/StrS family aminotransferase [Comamonas testosteroni]|uniref:DegT/DnrJ/EryC1/StrS family aminotransferase n=1 Tax=Comamonas testosteroni TaxID=285 RepID=UPI003D0E3462